MRKSFIKRSLAVAAAAVMATISIGAFATTDTSSGTKTLGGKTYNWTVYNSTSDSRYTYDIEVYTKVTPTPSTVYAAYQIVRSTGEDFGKKVEDKKTNATYVEVGESISHYAPISKFTVFGAHTSWCSSGEIIEKYTTSYNY